MTISFNGAAKRLGDLDLPRIGHEIGVGEDEIHAIIEVETRGGGFDDQGRPKILFEPHVFYRNLSGGSLATAVRQGLAYPDWGEKPYPKDSYPRLLQAIAIDETAALKSASWGLGQILGENFVDAGFPSVQAMVSAFCVSEANQLQAMIDFIKANHLDDEIRAHNWAAFARGYNGPKYRQNNYDTKLAAAYAKWRKIPDTPWTPNTPRPVPSPPAPTAPATPPAAPQPQAPEPAPAPPQASPAGFWAGLIAAILKLFRRT